MHFILLRFYIMFFFLIFNHKYNTLCARKILVENKVMISYSLVLASSKDQIMFEIFLDIFEQFLCTHKILFYKLKKSYRKLLCTFIFKD